MDPISNADGLILLLRQKLRERARLARGNRSERSPNAVQELGTSSSIQRLVAVEGVDEHQLRRALVQNLLAEQLGPALLNDAQFQHVITRVTEVIEQDADASNLIAQVLSTLRD